MLDVYRIERQYTSYRFYLFLLAATLIGSSTPSSAGCSAVPPSPRATRTAIRGPCASAPRGAGTSGP